MTPPPPPRGVKWSNWHRIQDLFIRPIRSASSSVPAGRPGRVVLRVRDVYSTHMWVCGCTSSVRLVYIYLESYFYGLSLSLSLMSVFFPVVFLLVLSTLQSSATAPSPFSWKPTDRGEFSSPSLFVSITGGPNY